MSKTPIIFLGVALAGGMLSPAQAQTPPDVMAVIKALEARVATLEAENRKFKAEAARKNSEPKPHIPARTAETTPAPEAYALVSKAPVAPRPEVPSWQGLYAGGAFGVGWMGARSRSQFFDTSSDLFNDTDPTFPFTELFQSTSTTVAQGRGRSLGAFADLFLGYNFRLGSNVVGGVQVEGTLAHLPVRLRSSETGSQVTVATVLPGGTPTISTSTFTDTFEDELTGRWMVSVLGRLGVLATPNDLLYVIGGYTHARIDALTSNVGLHGGTIGLGGEHKVDPLWTLRAE